ncbi:hypothetical protein J7T55_010551 [Diaporthe amygdali]|uniref:uncharacterized protein n=1 Tax=Phomopsis amygdali TaxID=1214568 RepID=UPI0022FF1A9F|nr:uncharacterized protein J7T55_010551 [Diaporthe amygdali]KAJ0115728.1 hypothetical protein J7T55_010551 [Diaporthe amygdali]
MAPARAGEVSWPTGMDVSSASYEGSPRNAEHINNIRWDLSLKPKRYEMLGTPPDSSILFLDVNIIDSTGAEPYNGDVLIQGLGDGHTHLTWNGGDLNHLGDLGVEEHTLVTVKSARCFLDSGYTMCFGAASAKERLDVVIRDAINAGDIPGPRYLANGMELARRDGTLVAGITAAADGPDEMQTLAAQDCYFTDEETAACVDEAHKHGKRLCAHARARDSVIMCVRHGVEAIYHASFIDDQGMDMLEKAKTKHVVVPAINWLIATLHEAEAFGYTHAQADKAGYTRELNTAIAGLREMHRRGIVVLPGGDYGFAWTPHGTYARDLEHFVKLLGFTPHEAIIAATAGVAALMMRADELGRVQRGCYADCILVDGDPLADISVLQDHSRLNVICINGRIHKVADQDSRC